MQRLLCAFLGSLTRSPPFSEHSQYSPHFTSGKTGAQKGGCISHSLEQVRTRVVSVMQRNRHPHAPSCAPLCLPSAAPSAGRKINGGQKTGRPSVRAWLASLCGSQADLLALSSPQPPTLDQRGQIFALCHTASQGQSCGQPRPPGSRWQPCLLPSQPRVPFMETLAPGLGTAGPLIGFSPPPSFVHRVLSTCSLRHPYDGGRTHLITSKVFFSFFLLGVLRTQSPWVLLLLCLLQSV